MQESSYGFVFCTRSADPRGGGRLRPAVAAAASPREESGKQNRLPAEGAGTVKFWRKKDASADAGRGVARAALEGASRLELAGEAIHELRAAASGDRIGVWMECASYVAEEIPEGTPPAVREPADHDPSEHEAGGQPGSGAETVAVQTARLHDRAWRGVVWDRESETPPAEWEHLSDEAPLPPDLLVGGRAAEQELDGRPQSILISVLMELRKALWVPIASRGHLRGVILCGTRETLITLERPLPQRLAAELALQLEWEDQRVVARERYADIAVAKKLHAELAAGGQTEQALARLADSIVDVRTGGSGIGAAFALIGVLPGAARNKSSVVDFRWKSGDADWLQTAESEMVSGLWQEALRTRRVAGMEPHVTWMHTAISRIVAVPLEAEGEICGVLLAGLLRRGTALSSLERLEYRATLAGLAIASANRERAAAQAAQRQRAHLAASQDCLFVLGESGRLTEMSGAAVEWVLANEQDPSAKQNAVAQGTIAAGDRGLAIVGEPRTAGAGAPFTSFFPENARPRLEEWLQRAMLPDRAGSWHATEDVLDVELRNGHGVRLRRGFPAASGQTVVVLESAGRRSASPGEVEAELALQGVIEWLEEGVVMFDAHENVRAFNARFEQLAGLPPSESAKGSTLEKLIARIKPQAAEPAKFEERWRELARGLESGVRDELRMVHPAPRVLERAARPVLDAAGRKLGRVEVYRDLTAQRMFQSQLLQTEKLAALGQMLTGVAHELSNPLTSILGYAQRLLLREESSARMPEVRQIFQEAERAGGILRQLLFNAREAPPERRRVSLNQVVTRSMELQRFSIAAEQVRVELDLDAALPFVMGDAAQLQQILMNLVGNARQAIQHQGRGGRIRVRTRQVAERRVQLEVEDDGPGVPQSILARIFDPFFTTKAAGVGTGLGLSIVLSIVREHGGRVSVLDAPEGGAVFSIELPAAEMIAAAPSRATENFELELALSTATGGEPKLSDAASRLLANPCPPLHGSVLVVEDEPTVARLIADVLQDEGFTVEVLLDGREGLKRAAERTFDLVICDMRMPALDGQQFYQSLVRSGNPLQHSVLFVTGDVIAPATHAFLDRHQLPHLAKPFRVEELTERVRTVLESRGEPPEFAKALAARSAAGKDTRSNR